VRGGHATLGSLRRRRLVWGIALAVGLAVLFVLALSQSLTSAASSDGAANILQAHAMLHGNPLLRGWWTSDVSFYTTELPEYVLVLAARGLSPDVVHICGALTYTLTVALAALLARGNATGAAGLRRAGLAVGIMLAPSIHGGTEVFLENPDHFGTSVPMLVLLLLLDWGSRPGRRDRLIGRWYVAAAACVLLTWTQVGDELSLVAVTVPVAAVCAYRLVLAAVRRRPRAGLRADGPLLAAALVSVGAAKLAKHAIRALGGFDLRSIPGGRLAPLGRLAANARQLWQSIVELFGANNPGTPHRPITISQHDPLVLITYLHFIGLVLAVAGLVAGIAAGFFYRVGATERADRSGQPDELDEPGRDGERVIQILVVAIGVTMAAAVLGTMLQVLANTHDIAILMPLGAVLAGRTLPPLAGRLMPGIALPTRVLPTRVLPGRLAAAALVAWLTVGVAEMGYAATWPVAPMPVQSVADWLAAHHERDGLAGYWQAAVTTMATGGRILVAPVTASAAAPMRWEASSNWYRPSLHRATFVIVGAHQPQPEDPLQVAVVRARFGAPAAEYQVGEDIIMIYRYNLLTRLDDRAFPGHS
jgi:hypothetical protein